MSVRLDFLHGEGFKQILQSEGTKAMISGHANAIKARADANLNGAESEGFNEKVIMGGYGGGRWVGIVGTSDLATVIAESENKALTKAVHG